MTTISDPTAPAGPSTAPWIARGDRLDRASKRSGDELLDRTIARLAKTEHGRELAALLRERRDDIVVVDVPAGVLPEGAGAAWVPARQKLYVRRDQLERPYGITLLAHEAVHMRDTGSLLQTFGRSTLGMGRALLDMAVAPVRGRNPVSAGIDGVRGAFQIPLEVDAYRLQGELSQELGLRYPEFQHADGSPKSDEELRSWLLEEPLYQLPPTSRLLLGTGFAALGGMATGQAANAALARLAPASWVGRHSGVVTAGALAAWGALLVQDQLAARR